MSEPNAVPPCGFRSLVLLVIASMVGAGVFTTSGFTLAAVGSPLRVMLCWLVGAIIAICGAIAYGQLAKRIPESGGEYLYLSRYVHPFAGFLAGWVSLTAGFSGATAVAALTLEQYALPQAWRPSWLPPDAIAVAVILFCGHVHGNLIRTGIRLQNVAVVLQLAALAAFFGITGWNASVYEWHTAPLNEFATAGWNLVNAMAVSVVWISLSYAGFNAAIYVASESADARRSVPQALLTGTIIVTVLYLFLNAIFVGSVPAEELAGQSDVAAVAGRALGGNALEALIRVAVAVGLFTSVSGMILTGPRVYQRMAQDGVFPQSFAGPGSLHWSVGLQCLLAIGLIVIHRRAVSAGWAESSLSQLLSFLGATLSLSSAGCVATLFLPSVRLSSGPASIGCDLAAGIYVVATITAIILMTLSHDGNMVAHVLRHLTGTGIVMITGTAAWFVLRRNQRA